jgi:hypothetical protein
MQRDKRILKILVPFGVIFSILAAMSDYGEFLFGLVVVGTLWLFSRFLLSNRWYLKQSLRHSNGEFKLFPIIQLLIILPTALLFIFLGVCLVAVLENAL